MINTKNIPNYLTILRLFLAVPFIVLFIMPLFFANFQLPNYSTLTWQLWSFLSAGIIFTVAMITDFLDGYLARKNNHVSNFGKLADPIADKIITNSALIIFAVYQIIPVWVVLIIIMRDVIVNSIRSVSAADKVIISASILGKIKTLIITFAIMILFFITPLWNLWSEGNISIYNNDPFLWIVNIPLLLGTIITIWSGYQYGSQFKLKI